MSERNKLVFGCIIGETDHYGGPVQREVMELKIMRRSLERNIEDGLRQTADYMDLSGSVDEGYPVIFDRTQTKSWDECIWHCPYEHASREMRAWTWFPQEYISKIPKVISPQALHERG